jgi:putative membrane protein
MGDALYFVVGLFFGFLSGLLPGLHSNTVISILSSLGIEGSALAIMIIALYPASLVASFIPAIFFGIPEQSTVVAVLPGQRMVLGGQGLAALKTVLLSCVLAALVSSALFYASLDAFRLVYDAVRDYMRYILLAISLALLSRSRHPALASFVFAVSGLLGQFSLNSGMRDPFLPLFSGMFALAAIANYGRNAVPPQKDTPVGLGFARFALLGVFLGMAADLIPGIGSPSQVATFATIFMPIDTLGYLAAASSISVSQAIFSLSTSAAIDKSRVGATAWLAANMDVSRNLLLLLALFLVSISLSVAVLYAARKRLARLATFDYSHVNKILAAYIVAITLIIDGPLGLVVLALAAALGWLTTRIGVERTNLMGSVIVPTLLLLFRIFI